MSNVLNCQKLSLFLKRMVLISGLFYLSGCTENIREETSAQIQTLVTQTTNSDNSLIWYAPELQHRQFRLAFYGYDTVAYKLKAIKDQKSTHFRLLLDVNYGANQGLKIRHYDQAKLEDGSTLITDNRRLETGRCQFFSTMTFSCLYRDRAEIELNSELLIASKQTGLRLTLGTADLNYEQIDLPANYVQGFLQALQIQ